MISGYAPYSVFVLQGVRNVLYALLVVVFVNENHDVILRENVCKRILGADGKGYTCKALKNRRSRKQQYKDNRNDIPRTDAVAAGKIHMRKRSLFMRLFNRLFANQNKCRQQREHAHHAYKHALGEHHSDLRPDFEAEQRQHRKPHHRRERA